LGAKGGIAELLSNPWFKGMNFIDLLDRKVINFFFKYNQKKK
jgi:hypothetical protein